MDSQSIQYEEQSAWNQLEFALTFLHPCRSRFERMKTQLESKLAASNGEVQYSIGLDGRGEPIGLSSDKLDLAISTMRVMASQINTNLIVLSRNTFDNGMIAQVLFRKYQMQAVIMDIRIALLGETQVGKSTLVGVLTKGIRENGKGSARNAIHKHLHEKKIGSTATVTQHLLGFDCEGKVLKNNKDWTELVLRSSKLISFIDLPGKKKYRNTFLYGLISQSPDYAILMIDSTSMDPVVNVEYLNLITALNLPFVVILSKSERISSKTLESTLDFLQTELRKRDKILMEVLNQDDLVLYSRVFIQESIIPLFTLSLKTQKNTELLINFLNLLPSRNTWDQFSSVEFYLEKWYIRESCVILCGIMIKGKALMGEKLLLGPDTNGNFHSVQISGIHVKEVSVNSVTAGQFCSFQVQTSAELRRGMVLVDHKAHPISAYEFECVIFTIDTCQDSRILKSSYKPLIYTQTITQCAYIVSGPKIVSPNLAIKLKFHFLYNAEYLTIGTKLMIKDTFMTALGTITSVENSNP